LNLPLFIRVFHPVITGMGGERLEALFKKRDILRPAYKTHVGYGMNKGPRVFDRPLFPQIDPEPTAKIELGVYLQSLCNVDTAVTFLRGIVQFTERRMAGAG